MAKKTIFNKIPEEFATASLAFIGGFVDSAGYIKLQDLFTSSITGNLVVACASIFNSYGVVCRVFVSLAFSLGVGCGTSLALRFKIVEEYSLKVCSIFMFSAVILTFFVALIFGSVFNDDIDDNNSLDNINLIVAGSLMAFAMGMHNSAAKESIANCPATTVMTMTLVTISTNLSTLSNYLCCIYIPSLFTMRQRKKSVTEVEYQKAIVEKYLDFKVKFVSTSKPLIGFLLGALVGAAAMTYMDFYCLFIPIGINAVLIIDIYTGIAVDSVSSINNNVSSTAADKIMADGKGGLSALNERGNELVPVITHPNKLHANTSGMHDTYITVLSSTENALLPTPYSQLLTESDSTKSNTSFTPPYTPPPEMKNIIRNTHSNTTSDNGSVLDSGNNSNNDSINNSNCNSGSNSPISPRSNSDNAV